MVGYDPPTVLELRWGTDGLRIELDRTRRNGPDARSTRSASSARRRVTQPVRTSVDRLACELDGAAPPG